MADAVATWDGLRERLDAQGRAVDGFGGDYVTPADRLDELADRVATWERAGGSHVTVNTMGLGLTTAAAHIEALTAVAATLGLTPPA